MSETQELICENTPLSKDPRFQNFTGKIFWKYTVLKYMGKNKKGESLWLCRCSCVNQTEKIVNGPKLKSGKIQSCGCNHNKPPINKTHGKSKTPEYKAWDSMIYRCYNNKARNYHLYGGRGIVVCDGWRNSSTSFLKDMGQRPSSNHSLDRIDNNSHYSCGHCEQCLAMGWTANCKWSTNKEQSNNRRRFPRIFFEYNGKMLSYKEMSEISNQSVNTIRFRIKAGWSIDEVLSQETFRGKKRRPK